MLVTLIPFFLAARLAVEENAWKHGPEYVYHLEINRTVGGVKDGYVGYFLCRPKDSDELSCRMDDMRGYVVHKNGTKATMTLDEVREITLQPFEIKFDEAGVDYLIAEHDLFALMMNRLRNIAVLLNVGAVLGDQTEESFETEENIDLGRCNVTFDVQRLHSLDVDRRGGKPSYKLEPRVQNARNHTVKIVKTTHLSDCESYADFYYGTYGNTVVDKDVDVTLLNSIQRIDVSESEFATRLVRKGLIKEKDKGDVEYSDVISLLLEDIREATEKLPIIPNASMTNITANCRFEKLLTATVVQN